MGEMDAAYRRLFQHKELLRDLLACVLSRGLFEALDWDRMRSIHTNHVSERLRQRNGDCAWLIPRKQPPRDQEGSVQAPLPDLCILLLLEQQQEPDDLMALRLVVYAGLTYQTLINNGLIRPPLPPVLPVVLYSGPRRWRAPQDFSALLADAPAALQPYQPRMRYLLIQEAELLEHADLPEDNLAALMLRLADSRNVEQWRGLLHTLIQAIAKPGLEELNRSLTAWLRLMAESSAPAHDPLPRVNTLQELDMMIAEKPGVWARQWLQEGREEGQAELLLDMIQCRFGPVPDEVAQRIQAAPVPQLKTWALNFVNAATLDEVFRS